MTRSFLHKRTSLSTILCPVFFFHRYSFLFSFSFSNFIFFKSEQFSYDKMLDLKGNTAIYLMYSYARICSIANKAGVQKSDLASVLPSVKVCVCMYVRMFLSLSLSLSLSLCVCVCVIWYDKSAQQFRLRPPVCHGVSVYVFTHVCMSVSVCVHACMHVCMALYASEVP